MRVVSVCVPLDYAQMIKHMWKQEGDKEELPL